MKTSVIGAVLALALAAAAQAAEHHGATVKKQQIDRGRYLAIVGGCNDCHTAGFAQRDGDVPEAAWLTGDGTVGWRGPWGTTYPTNLRLNLGRMSEAQWVSYAKTFKARPPMPWFNVNKWTEGDLRAFYQYVRHLGPSGQPAPHAVPPGQEPGTPVITFPEPPGGKS